MKRTLTLVIGGIAILLIGVGIGVNLVTKDRPAVSPRPAVAQEPEVEVEPEPEPEFYEPTEEDWELNLKVLEESDYGSAGGLVTVRVKLTQLFVGDLDPSKTYELTYEIRGDENGPKVDTIDITDDQYEITEQMISTPPGKGSSDLSIKIVGFEEF